MNDNQKLWHSFTIIKNVFFSVRNKVYLWFLNKFIAKEDEFYGFTEPSHEWMVLHNKKFWIQPCNEEDDER